MEVDREIERGEVPDVAGEKLDDTVKDKVENEFEETAAAGELLQSGEIASNEVDQTDSKVVVGGDTIDSSADMVTAMTDKSCDMPVPHQNNSTATKEKSCDLLVPYQDSSATEVEGMDEERGDVSAMAATNTVDREKPTSDELAIDQAMAEAEPGTEEGEEGIMEESGDEDGGKKKEEEEDEASVTAEDSLLISVHVNDTIDGTSGDLLDAECPSLQKAGT